MSFRKLVNLMRKRTLWVFIGIALCFIGYFEFVSDHKEDPDLNKRSVVQIKRDIAGELKTILLSQEKEKPKREIDFKAISEHRRRLLSNPDLNKHQIKQQKEVVFNGTALNKYIDILQHKDAPVKVLHMDKSYPVQFPSIKAPIFMQDLPYRWNIGKSLLTPWKVEKRFTSKAPLKHECFRSPQTRWNMIALVKSWVVNSGIRDAIRETWGKINSMQGVELHVVFLLAKAPTDTQRRELEKENNKHGDILLIDAAEQLKFFTVRTVTGMAWVSQHFPSDFLYSSLDDNMVPTWHNLIPVLDPFVKQAPILNNDECRPEFVFPFLCGYSLRIQDKPTRNPRSPWSMSSELYPPDVLPPHCQGGFYTTSVSTVNLVVDAATKTYPSHFDAVWITGILRQKLGLNSESIKDLTKVRKDLVQYLEYEIAENIRKKWISEEASLVDLNVVYRTEQ